MFTTRPVALVSKNDGKRGKMGFYIQHRLKIRRVQIYLAVFLNLAATLMLYALKVKFKNIIGKCGVFSLEKNTVM